MLLAKQKFPAFCMPGGISTLASYSPKLGTVVDLALLTAGSVPRLRLNRFISAYSHADNVEHAAAAVSSAL